MHKKSRVATEPLSVGWTGLASLIQRGELKHSKLLPHFVRQDLFVSPFASKLATLQNKKAPGRRQKLYLFCRVDWIRMLTPGQHPDIAIAIVGTSDFLHRIFVDEFS